MDTLATPKGDGHIFYEVKESRASFEKMRTPEGRSVGHGQFYMVIHITALQGDVYIPTSLASGKKPTGFVYQIEGSAQGQIDTTDISCKGEGVSQVTLGTLVYTKIPQGKTASFTIVVNMTGKVNKTYQVVFNRINYKLNASEARYKKLDLSIPSKPLEFKY